MSNTLKSLDGLSPEEKRSLLARLLEEKSDDQVSICPLSYNQSAIWFLYKLAPESAAYNVSFALRIRSEIDTAAFRRAFQMLVDRHEILRTVYTVNNGEPVQLIHKRADVGFEEIDASSLSLAELQLKVIEEYRRPFDLERGPVMQVKLLKRSATHYVLLLCVHHIAIDMWSLGLLFDELRVLYSAEKNGSPVALAGPSRQYADFVRWQADMLSSERGEQLFAYWQKQLAGDLPVLNLPADRPRPPVQTYSGASHSFKLNKELAERIKSLAQAQGVTPYVTLLAAFYILLYRYTDQEDILSGFFTVGRSKTEFEQTVGFLANSVVLRANVAGDQIFTDFLADVRQTVIAALDHQDYPFPLLVERLQPARDPSRSPLFQVVFQLQKLHRQEDLLGVLAPTESGLRTNMGELALETFQFEQQHARFDLEVEMMEAEDEFYAVALYNNDLFDGATIARMMEHFEAIIESAIQQPDQSVANIAAVVPAQTISLVIASTFTSELIEESLAFWMERFRIPSRIRFAPYNQVFQQLLDPASLLGRHQEGVQVILLRVEDWVHMETDSKSESAGRLEQNVDDFLDALELSRSRLSSPCILCLCPPSDDAIADRDKLDLVRRMEARIFEKASLLNETYIISESDYMDMHGTKKVNNPGADLMGHVPYTQSFFDALGTSIARKIFSLQEPVYKVLVIDCDQTLWTGFCGEDGPANVEMSKANLALQEFLLTQHKAGKLLCLSSKNSESDVFGVFKSHPDMPLKSKHLLTWRINWEQTPQNIKSLADELHLPLDAFVYISSSPVECAAVQSLCPQVLCLQIPADDDGVSNLLKHVWAFDQSRAAFV